MSDTEIRLACLKAAADTASGHDVLEMAARYLAFVLDTSRGGRIYG